MSGTRLVMAGRPGAGKGTQAARLAARWRLPHVSTGALFRDEMRLGTALGREVADDVASGRAVRDALVTRLVESRLSRGDAADGFVLDGFPRTIGQAALLFELIEPDGLDAIIELAVPATVVLQRLTARARDDDHVAAVRSRLCLYERQTAPMLRWQQAKGVLVRVDGDRPADVVETEVLTRLTLRRPASLALTLTGPRPACAQGAKVPPDTDGRPWGLAAPDGTLETSR